jgi:pilus assembly protein Flp/PilA
MVAIARLWRDEAGATNIEYALIASIVAIGIIAAVQGITTELNATFGVIASAF